MSTSLEDRLRAYRVPLESAIADSAASRAADAPTPRKRPIVWVGLAAACVAALVIGALLTPRGAPRPVNAVGGSAGVTSTTGGGNTVTFVSMDRLANLALTTSAHYGDSKPSSIVVVRTSWRRAFTLTDPEFDSARAVPGWSADKVVFVVQVRGSYVTSTHPAGRATGAILLIVDASTGLPMDGSSPSAVVEPIESLGAPQQLAVPATVQNPEPIDPTRLPGKQAAGS